MPSRCIDGGISVREPIFVNDNKNALFFLDNNVTSIVRYFSVISAPLDQELHEVQSQLVPKFSHAFFLSTHLWVFAKHLINLCQIHHCWQKFAFFEKSVIVKVAFLLSHLNSVQTFHVIFFPNLPFSPKFAILVKISNYQQAIFRHLIWQAIHYFLTNSLFSPNLSFL